MRYRVWHDLNGEKYARDVDAANPKEAAGLYAESDRVGSFYVKTQPISVRDTATGDLCRFEVWAEPRYDFFARPVAPAPAHEVADGE